LTHAVEKRTDLAERNSMITVRAVYAGGVLRPMGPLALDEGDTVEITVAKMAPAGESDADDDVTQKLKAAKTIAEWVAATRLLPPDDGGYDILKSLNENRISSGERPLIPDKGTRS
jgi:predicted DNA-binding antitoxin AbrB/MazE fold protein